MLWSQIAPHRCSPLCTDHNVERYNYSQRYEARYGIKYRTNKLARMDSLQDLDAVVAHFAVDLPTEPEAIRKLLRGSRMMTHLDRATRDSVSPFLAAAKRSGQLRAVVEAMLSDTTTHPLYYAFLVRAQAVADILRIGEASWREELAAWLCRQMTMLADRCRIPHVESADTLAIPMFVAAMEASIFALKIHLAQKPDYLKNLIDAWDFTGYPRDIAEVLFVFATRYRWIKRYMGRDQVEAAATELVKTLRRRKTAPTPLEQDAIALVLSTRDLHHPFSASRPEHRQHEKLRLNCRDLIRFGGNRWEHSVLAQALLRHDFTADLLEFGIDPDAADQLLQHRSLRKLVQDIHGTAHEEEVRHIQIGWLAQAGMDPFYSLSCLEALHTNPLKHKVDRQAYLTFLKRINDANEHRAAWHHPVFFNANPEIFHALRTLVDFTAIPTWLQGRIDGAEVIDVFRLAHEAVYASGDPAQIERQHRLVERWLEKNPNDPRRLHSYLVDKLKRDQIHLARWSIECSTPFPGAALLHQRLDAASFTVDGQRFRFFVPDDGNALRSIGKAQKHCIGGANYRHLGITGQSLYVVVIPDRSYTDKHGHPRAATKTEFWRQVGDGYALQLDRGLSLRQAKGRQNTPCPGPVRDAALGILQTSWGGAEMAA